MMKKIFLPVILCWCFGLLVVTAVRAGDAADLLNGYGKVRWGQNLETVKAAYPGGTVGGSLVSPGPHELPLGKTEYSVYFVNAPEPLSGFSFGFQDDQLCKVTLTFSERTAAAITDGQIADELWRKYFTDPAIRLPLEAQRIHIEVKPLREGRPPGAAGFVVVDKHRAPSEPKDLLAPNGSQNLEVVYENDRMADEADAKARARRQQAIEAAAGISLHDIL